LREEEEIFKNWSDNLFIDCANNVSDSSDIHEIDDNSRESSLIETSPSPEIVETENFQECCGCECINSSSVDDINFLIDAQSFESDENGNSNFFDRIQSPSFSSDGLTFTIREESIDKDLSGDSQREGTINSHQSVGTMPDLSRKFNVSNIILLENNW
jgi:hypothetical protein